MSTLNNSAPVILIVEDSVDYANLIGEVLDRLPAHHHHVMDGDAALQYLDRHTPDLVLLDINLPGMNGWTVLEVIRQRHERIDYPVIALTAQDDPANKLIGKFLSEVHGYITKPFTPNLLINTIKDVLNLN